MIHPKCYAPAVAAGTTRPQGKLDLTENALPIITRSGDRLFSQLSVGILVEEERVGGK